MIRALGLAAAGDEHAHAEPVEFDLVHPPVALGRLGNEKRLLRVIVRRRRCSFLWARSLIGRSVKRRDVVRFGSSHNLPQEAPRAFADAVIDVAADR